MSKVAALKIDDLTRSFQQAHKALEVLKGVNLTVKPGEMVGLIGASGSGKSTLLQCAGLLDRATSGTITIDGMDVADLEDHARTRIRREKLGFIYQFHHLLPEFTALENVALAARISGESDKSARDEASHLLDELGLTERKDHIPAKLSGGEQQRVAIARALASKPQLLLADEPTGNLDHETADRVFELFVRAVRHRGLSAVVATHDTGLAAKMDQQYHLENGLLLTK